MALEEAVQGAQDTREGGDERPVQRIARPDSSTGTRRTLLVTLVAVVVPLAALTPLTVKAWQRDAFAWDVYLSEKIHAHENRDTLLDELVDPFGLVLDPAVHGLGWLILLVVLLSAILRRHRRPAVFIAIVLAGALVMAPIFEALVQRPPVFDRTANGDSFPASHAVRTAVVWLALSLLLWRTAWRWPVVVIGSAIVLLTGVGVVYHEWHWASDVLGGWFFAVAWVMCAWLASRPASPCSEPR